LEQAFVNFVLDHVHEAVFLSNEKGKILSVNLETSNLLEYSRDELLRMSIPDIAPEYPQNKWPDHWKDLKNSRSLIFESVLRSKSGKEIPVEIIADYFEFRGESFNFGLVRNISERQKFIEKITSAGYYNRNLIEVSLDPLVAIGSDGKITDVNQATEKATGFSRNELIGTDFSNYFTNPAKANEGFRKVFREGFIRDYPLEIRHREGKTTPVLYNATVYRGRMKRSSGFAAARDISQLIKVRMIFVSVSSDTS
jgi:PAS domain S-box-containing protein